jgi:hypothetical protein
MITPTSLPGTPSITLSAGRNDPRRLRLEVRPRGTPGVSAY